MVNRVAMMYGQLPHVIDALPASEKIEMMNAVVDLAEYEKERWGAESDEEIDVE
jgi:hypothetical protein